MTCVHVTSEGFGSMTLPGDGIMARSVPVASRRRTSCRRSFRVPRRLGRIVRDRAHHSEVDAREALHRVQIHGQRQIVARLVIVRGQEPPEHLLAVHGWVLRRESRDQVHRRHALLDERGTGRCARRCSARASGRGSACSPHWRLPGARRRRASSSPSRTRRCRCWRSGTRGMSRFTAATIRPAAFTGWWAK